MLSAQARSGIKMSRSASAGHINMQTRHFWPFNKRSLDWSSHLDPHFHRYHRQRNIATRAKLLKSIRRLNKWDLGDSATFFTPRHIRLASHYNGRLKPRWVKESAEEDGDVQENQDTRGRNVEESKDHSDQDKHELSERERLWKEHIERVRRRIERDPYEAVFGRRFEPFWSGLMPRWSCVDSYENMTNGQKAAEDVATKDPSRSDAKNAEPKTYAYSSSSAWNSWTNKAVKTEWDSVSGETKHYEYDPISNRMVQVQSDAKPIEQGRKAIPVPFVQAEDVSRSAACEAVVHPESVKPKKLVDASTATAVRSAAEIRASMHKLGSESAVVSQDQQQIDALLQESGPKKIASSRWDHAEQYYMLEQELQTLKAKRDNLVNEERRAFHFGDLARRHDKLEQKIKAAMTKLEVLNNELIHMNNSSAGSMSNVAGARPKTIEERLRPAVDRMQSKPALTAVELDDSAAHESTEVAANVPKTWTKQADLLQADRVKRTSSKVPYPEHPPKWVNDMADRQEALANDKAAAERAIKLAKTNEMLQAEVDRQKLVMSAHVERRSKDVETLRAEIVKRNEQRNVSDQTTQSLQSKVSQLEDAEVKYKSKITALKQELDTAYKQSSLHADEFRDQVKKAEQRGHDAEAVEAKWKTKFATMKQNLDQAYQQSSRHADELKDQLKKAEARAEILSAQVKSKTMRSQLLDERFARYKAANTSKQIDSDQTTSSLAKPAPLEPDFKEVKHAYKFVPDDLETELTMAAKQTVPETNAIYRFKKPSDSRPPIARLHQQQDRLTAARRELRSEMSDLSKMMKEVKNGREAVNPIDGTTAPVTGNYASPTGFVRYDQIPKDIAAENKVKPIDKLSGAEINNRASTRKQSGLHQMRRQERVFTGSKRIEHTQDAPLQFRHSYRRRRARRNRFIKFVTIAGAIALTTAYVKGMHMENEEIKLQGSREAWQKIASEYEKAGEKGVVQAMQDMKQVDQKTHSGLFWK